MSDKNNALISVLFAIAMVGGLITLNSIDTMTSEMKLLFSLVIFIFTMFIFILMALKR